MDKELEGEGIIPYCEHCQTYRFPIFSTAVSMVVRNPENSKILLIKQYGRDWNILVAGYVNKGEAAEHAVAREVMEEMGLQVSDIRFNRSEYFEPSNTLMLNFTCIADTDDLSGMTDEVDSAAWYPFTEAASQVKQESLAEKFLLSFLEKWKDGAWK